MGYEDKNASLRQLFEQRLDTLRNHILGFLGNALRDETARILCDSEATRAFVVDRILEIVSSDLESEKEATIFKLIKRLNQATKECDQIKLKNEKLMLDIEDCDELKELRRSVKEK